jgi:hypothetical protein
MNYQKVAKDIIDSINIYPEVRAAIPINYDNILQHIKCDSKTYLRDNHIDVNNVLRWCLERAFNATQEAIK